MTLKTLNFSARLAASFFVGSILIGTFSSLIMLGLLLSEAESGFVFPTLEGIRIKYAYPLLVSSMKTSMYEYVADDEDIEIVQQWIDEGTKEDFFKAKVQPIMKMDCTSCHSKSSTKTKAVPGMPLGRFEEVKAQASAGYTWAKMSRQAHFHLFGIGVFLAILSLMMAYSSYFPWIRNLLISTATIFLWLDVMGWWLTKYLIEFAYVIYFAGAVMSGSILAMAGLVLLDLWLRVPWITESSR
ncbi:MAG: hypothetical protein IIC13_06395 [SAR324 cluster bacterium]|nr:hypothetical protein [SAR324 cluster bacterium]